jgi:hypothetical protein
MMERSVKSRLRQLLSILRQTYPDAHCALNFTSPLELLIATILSAQCTDVRVNLVTPTLFQKYRTAADYVAADPEELAQDIQSTGFYRQKAHAIQRCCAALEQQYDGAVPDTMEALVGLPGVGRKTANVVLDEAAASIVDEDSGDLGESTGGRIGKKNASSVDVAPSGVYRAGDPGFGDRGGASRFFYCAKADRSEREAGLDRTNHHPTVKPVDLMQWLCRMVTPRAGTVLDPFCGSGSTGIAALREGLDFVGIELVPDYAAIARRRIEEDAPLFNRQL